MPRTIVYSRPHVPPDVGAESVPAAEDSYPEKLVKYVPAEVLAFFVPISVQVRDSKALLLTSLIAGLGGTVGYLWLSAREQPADKRPYPYFYVLAAIAFLAWAIGTNEQVAGLIGLNQFIGSAILGLGVFVIPLLDNLFAALLGKGKSAVSRQRGRPGALRPRGASSP